VPSLLSYVFLSSTAELNPVLDVFQLETEKTALEQFWISVSAYLIDSMCPVGTAEGTLRARKQAR
jgi:hypothetical protein